MSGVGFYANTGEVSLSAATAKTIFGLAAAANHRVEIKKLLIGFKGTTVTNEPVTIELIRFTSDGTGTAGTIVKKDADASETPEVAFKYNYSAEPTGITVLQSFPLHPQGLYGETLPIELPIPVSGSDFWGIRCTADDAVTVMAALEGDE